MPAKLVGRSLEFRVLSFGCEEAIDFGSLQSCQINLPNESTNRHVAPVVQRERATREDDHPHLGRVRDHLFQESEETEHLAVRLVAVVEYEDGSRPGKVL